MPQNQAHIHQAKSVSLALQNAESYNEVFTLQSHARADQLLIAIDRIRSSQRAPLDSSPMVHAALSLRADLIAPLSQRGFDVNENSGAFFTPLYSAINAMDHHSDAACVIELLRLGANPLIAKRNGESPLSRVLEKSRPAARALFSHGVSLEQLDVYGNPPLCAVTLRIDQGQREAADMISLLLELGASVNGKNIHQETPLICACEHASIPCAQTLLNAGADPNAQSEKGSSPLMSATQGPAYGVADDRARLVSLLLTAGADPEAKNQYGESALSIARGLIGADPSNSALRLLIVWGEARDLAGAINPAPRRVNARNGL